MRRRPAAARLRALACVAAAVAAVCSGATLPQIFEDMMMKLNEIPQLLKLRIV